MNTQNEILNALHQWLLQAGYQSYLNFTARPGKPCYGGTPNVSVAHENRQVMVTVLDDRVNAWLIRKGQVNQLRQLEIADPDLFEQLQMVVEGK